MRNTILYTILVLILITAGFQSCHKDEVVPSLNEDTFVSPRDGNFRNILYLTSLSLAHQMQPTQMAFNKDSVGSIQFEYSGVSVKTLTIITGEKIKAKSYRISVHFIDGSSYEDDVFYKDTVNTFTYIPSGTNTSPGNFNYIKYLRSSTKMYYYDTSAKIFKYKYQYKVKAGNIAYQDNIPSTGPGEIFWLNHKL